MVPTDGRDRPFFDRLAAHFNRRFEFYGRKIRLFYGTDGAGGPDPAVQRAGAVDADEKFGVFASSYWHDSGGLHYSEEASRRGIVNVTGSLPLSSATLRERRPYLWQYMMPSDEMFANLGEWACAKLAGSAANHSSDLRLRNEKRRFGVILQTFYDADSTKLDPIVAELSKCGARPVATSRNEIRTGAGEEGGGGAQSAGVDPVTTTQVMLKMKDAGATSIFCLCQTLAAGALMKSATNQQYFPEWLLSTYGIMDTNGGVTVASAPPEQMAAAFGVTFTPRQVKVPDEPVTWAVREIDPTYQFSGDQLDMPVKNWHYRALLLLASGIQMAGPGLTPQTFEQGLQVARFPNPFHPNQPGEVSFLGRRSAMTIDGAQYWWSNSARSPYIGGDQGSICYVDGGARHRRGAWTPGDDQFFRPPCDSGAP